MLTLVGKIGAVSRFRLQRSVMMGLVGGESGWCAFFGAIWVVMAGSLLAYFLLCCLRELGELFLGLLVGISLLSPMFRMVHEVLGWHVIGIDLKKV